jgi:hypothetical protein
MGFGLVTFLLSRRKEGRKKGRRKEGGRKGRKKGARERGRKEVEGMCRSAFPINRSKVEAVPTISESLEPNQSLACGGPKKDVWRMNNLSSLAGP